MEWSYTVEWKASANTTISQGSPSEHAFLLYTFCCMFQHPPHILRPMSSAKVEQDVHSNLHGAAPSQPSQGGRGPGNGSACRNAMLLLQHAACVSCIQIKAGAAAVAVMLCQYQCQRRIAFVQIGPGLLHHLCSTGMRYCFLSKLLCAMRPPGICQAHSLIPFPIQAASLACGLGFLPPPDCCLLPGAYLPPPLVPHAALFNLFGP